MSGVILTSKAEVERFLAIFEEEAKKLMDQVGGILDLNQSGVYAHLMDNVKMRFRAWQMEREDYEASGAACFYRGEAVRRELDERWQRKMKMLGR